MGNEPLKNVTIVQMLLNISQEKLDSVGQVNTGLVLLMKSKRNENKLQEIDASIPQHAFKVKAKQQLYKIFIKSIIQ